MTAIKENPEHKLVMGTDGNRRTVSCSCGVKFEGNAGTTYKGMAWAAHVDEAEGWRADDTQETE